MVEPNLPLLHELPDDNGGGSEVEPPTSPPREAITGQLATVDKPTLLLVFEL